ncbi:MAG: hypothetical protein GY821_08635 [Gammaproteobacteria bacterium]|nr:hypothetical protein [Gammaproteobacteria bacterium]
MENNNIIPQDCIASLYKSMRYARDVAVPARASTLAIMEAIASIEHDSQDVKDIVCVIGKLQRNVLAPIQAALPAMKEEFVHIKDGRPGFFWAIVGSMDLQF